MSLYIIKHAIYTTTSALLRDLFISRIAITVSPSRRRSGRVIGVVVVRRARSSAWVITPELHLFVLCNKVVLFHVLAIPRVFTLLVLAFFALVGKGDDGV